MMTVNIISPINSDIMNKVIEEIRACSEFLNLRVSEVSLGGWDETGASVYCTMGDQHVELPKIRNGENVRKLIVQYLNVFSPDTKPENEEEQTGIEWLESVAGMFDSGDEVFKPPASTGLKDKDGRVVLAGDIVADHRSMLWFIYWNIPEASFCKTFYYPGVGENGDSTDSRRMYGITIRNIGSYEVVGDIRDLPNMIEDPKNVGFYLKGKVGE